MATSAVRQPKAAREASIDLAKALGVPVGRGPGARSIALRTGPWWPDRDARVHTGGMPLLVIDGALLRSSVLRGREGAELLGPGDLVAVEPEDDGSVFATRVRALTRCRVAVLDARVRAAAAASPDLSRALFDSASRRTSAVAAQVVLAQLPAIDDRLRVLFPALAERWGIVTADGVLLPGFLSHSVLAALVGARRPSLTAAVARLVADGSLVRLPDRRWRLEPELAALS